MLFDANTSLSQSDDYWRSIAFIVWTVDWASKSNTRRRIFKMNFDNLICHDIPAWHGNFRGGLISHCYDRRLLIFTNENEHICCEEMSSECHFDFIIFYETGRLTILTREIPISPSSLSLLVSAVPLLRSNDTLLDLHISWPTSRVVRLMRPFQLCRPAAAYFPFRTILWRSTNQKWQVTLMRIFDCDDLLCSVLSPHHLWPNILVPTGNQAKLSSCWVGHAESIS